MGRVLGAAPGLHEGKARLPRGTDKRMRTMRLANAVTRVPDRQIVEVAGDDEGLVARLAEPLQRALSERRSFYAVRIEAVGRVGEVMVSIDGAKGRLPLLFRPEDMDVGYVCSVVTNTVRRYDF
jgi:hypothetical protein